MVKRRKDRKPMDFNSSKFLAVLLFNPDPTSNVATQIRLLEIWFLILEHIMTRTFFTTKVSEYKIVGEI